METQIKTIKIGRLLAYELVMENMITGLTLGNEKCSCSLRENGSLDSFYSYDIGDEISGSWTTKYREINLEKFLKEEKGKVIIHPAFFRKECMLSDGLGVGETSFVPKSTTLDMPAFIKVINVTNNTPVKKELEVIWEVDFSNKGKKEGLNLTFTKKYSTIRGKIGKSGWIVLGSSNPITEFNIKRKTDKGKVIVGEAKIRVSLKSGESRRFAIWQIFSTENFKKVLEINNNFNNLFFTTIRVYEEFLDISKIVTPQPFINQSILWIKCGLLKAMAAYPKLAGISSKNTYLNAEELAWFILGCNYFLPSFSRKIITNMARYQKELGFVDSKLPVHKEKYKEKPTTGDVVSTAMMIIVSTDLYLHTLERTFLQIIFPFLRRAGEALFSSINNVEGLKELTFVTYALNCLFILSKVIGEKELAFQCKEKFLLLKEKLAKSDKIKVEILFPIIFDLLPVDFATRGIKRLCEEDYLTGWGIRTMSRDSLFYIPACAGSNMGEVSTRFTSLLSWGAVVTGNNKLGWDVFNSILKNYINLPLQNLVIPGQFVEYFHGDAPVALSSIPNPSVLAVLLKSFMEGLLGIKMNEQGLNIGINLPPEWNWIAGRNIPYKGEKFSFFAIRDKRKAHIFSTKDCITPHLKSVFSDDISDSIDYSGDEVEVVSLEKVDDTVIFIGNLSCEPVKVTFTPRTLLQGKEDIEMAIYRSEIGNWINCGAMSREELNNIVARIEGKGFVVYRFRGEVFDPTKQIFKDMINELDEEGFSHLKGIATNVTFKPGSIIFRENDPGNAFYIIKSGKVRITKLNRLGKPEELAILKRGELFGEMAVIEDLPRTASAEAITEVELLVIKKEDFDYLLKMNPKVAQALIKILSKRLREADRQLSLFAR